MNIFLYRKKGPVIHADMHERGEGFGHPSDIVNPPVSYTHLIFAAVHKYLLDIPVDSIQDFEKGLFEFVATKYPEIPEQIRTDKQMSDVYKRQCPH